MSFVSLQSEQSCIYCVIFDRDISSVVASLKKGPWSQTVSLILGKCCRRSQSLFTLLNVLLWFWVNVIHFLFYVHWETLDQTKPYKTTKDNVGTYMNSVDYGLFETSKSKHNIINTFCERHCECHR